MIIWKPIDAMDSHTFFRLFSTVCFDPDTPENTTVGPVKTSFGYHLIYIDNRTLPEPEKAKSD